MRRLLLLAFVAAAFASFCFIERDAGAQKGNPSAVMDDRAGINSSAGEATDDSAQDANAGVPGCVTPPANMVAWYPGDGNALDLKGGDSATMLGPVTSAPGKVAQAFQFNGSGSLEVADAPALDVTTALTLDAWINPTAGNDFTFILGKGNFGAGNDQPYSLFYNGNNNTINFRVGNSSTFDALGSVTQVPLNSYTHVAATYDGTTMRLYINGVLDASKTTTIGTLVNSTQKLVIGQAYRGAIDELEIFSRALSAAEIQSIVTADSAGKCKDETPPPPPPTSCITPPANMAAWYPGDNTFEDIQGGNDGYVYNTGVSFTTGKVAQAFQFNGNGHVQVDDAPALDATTALTLDAWISPTAANLGMIVGKGDFGGIGGGQPYSLFFDSSRQITFRVGNASTFEALRSFTQLPLNAYTHVAATYDGTRMRLYINGNLEAVKTAAIGTLVNSNLPLQIGSSGYQGAIDEVEIFKRVLSPSEIQLLFAADSFGKCKCPVITLAPASLPNGTVGMPYSQTITASAGTAPRTFAVTAGALPPGLSLNSSTGVISGTPTTTSGSPFSLTITVTDANGCQGSGSYTLTIDPPPASNCVTPPSGMVAWLPGDNNANDIIGNNHGSLQNGATFAPGKVAQAFGFDGVDDYVLVNHSPSLMSAAITIDLWAYPTSYGPNYNRFVEKGGAAANDPGGYSLEFNPCANGQPSCDAGTQKVSFVIWSDTVGPFVVLNSNAPIPLNTWTHIAATFDGSTMALYINGALQGTAAASMGSTTDNLAIGRSPNAASHHFTGRIDELEIFDRALSQAEIQSIVDADSDGKCKPCPTITLSPASLPDGEVGTPYAQTIGASGAPGPFAFSVTSGELPPGLTLNSSTGELNGTPTASGPSTFTVTATDSGASCTGSRSYTLTISARPSLSVNNFTVTEGNSGTINAIFTITLTPSSGNSISVKYATANGTANPATAPADYTAKALTTLTFAPGETTKTVAVAVKGDTLDEENETFRLLLSAPTNATIADDEGVCTITDNDAAPSVSASDITVTEGNTGPTNATYTLKLSAASGRTASVSYTAANVTAFSSTDYQATSGTVTFDAGQVSKTVTVPVIGDVTSEPTETFRLNLSAPVNVTISDASAACTVLDNDQKLSVNSLSITEADTALALTVKLSHASTKTVTVKYATANGATNPAAAGTDYTALPLTTLTFQPGETSKTVAVTIKGDTLDEANETFRLNLSSPTNAGILTAQGTGTILDNDAAPALSVTSPAVSETNAAQAVAFSVKLSAPSGQVVTVKYQTSNGTALAPGDYTAKALATLTFLPGETAKMVQVTVAGDLLDEPVETFKLQLTSPTNATIAAGTGTCTITDNDSAPSITITDVSVAEPDTGARAAVFTVKLSAPSGQTVSVKYATANGTTNPAAAGTDYTAVALTTLTFLPGQTSKTVIVQVRGDLLKEFNETFFLNLSAATNATITDAQGLGTILNDD